MGPTSYQTAPPRDNSRIISHPRFNARGLSCSGKYSKIQADMKMSVFLIGAVLTTILAVICLSAVLIYLEPSADILTMSLFYLSLFVGAGGGLSLIGLFVRRLSRKSRSVLSVNRQLWDSFRQGMLLSVILTGALILQSKNVMTWWSLTILVGTVGLMEFLCAR
jgi:hypothetical protein